MNAAPKPDTFEREIGDVLERQVRVYPKLVEAPAETTPDDDERVIASCRRTIEQRTGMVTARKASTKERVAALRAEVASLNAEATRLNARDNRIIVGSRAALKAMGAE